MEIEIKKELIYMEDSYQRSKVKTSWENEF
jgi:hypothetical protein